MNALTRAAAIAATSLLAACGQPVPMERAAYVGVWEGPDVFLEITADGRVSYERRRGSGNVSIQAPIRRFEGDDFVVGFGPFSTTFKVSAPPRLDGNRWTMVVDGVPLRRTGGLGGGDEIRA